MAIRLQPCMRLSTPPPLKFMSLLGAVRVLLRKLWTKMSEPDWRTVSKAIYLFHAILRELPLEHHAVLKIFLGKVGVASSFFAACRTLVWRASLWGGWACFVRTQYVLPLLEVDPRCWRQTACIGCGIVYFSSGFGYVATCFSRKAWGNLCYIVYMFLNCIARFCSESLTLFPLRLLYIFW